MKIDVGQQRTDAPALNRAHLTACPLPVLQHAGVEPFLDQPHDAPVRHTVLDESHQPSVVESVEEAPDVGVEHPVHLLRHDPGRQRVQRLMRAAPWSEPIREPEEVRFVDGVEHLDDGALDDLVFQRGNPERPLPPVRLRDVRPTNRLRTVRSPLQPAREVPKVDLQVLSVVLPGLAVDACHGVPLQGEIGRAQPFDVVDVVQERGEPLPPVLLGGLPYPLERAWRACPARCPERVAFVRVPLGRPPSLRRLRRRLPGVVRRLPRYYGAVRLPAPVHHRRESLDFPVRPTASRAAGERGISRFPCEVLPCVLGVSDRAGSLRVSRWRRDGCGLPPVSTASAPRSCPPFSRLDTRPARPPVNASPLPLRATAHDSGPVWLATPSPYETSIRNTSPVWAGARTPGWTPDSSPCDGLPPPQVFPRPGATCDFLPNRGCGTLWAG